MESVGKKIGIYIELDALMDTRLATLFQKNELLAKQALCGNYKGRQEDAFEGMSKAQFVEAYAKRDKQTLKHAVVTKCIDLIKELAVELNKQMLSAPYHTGGKLFLNTYPYQLSENENDNFLKVLAHLTLKLLDIEIVHIAPAQLTPQYCKNNFTYLLMYEYGRWLDMHVEGFKALPCKEITLIAPALYFGSIPTEEEVTATNPGEEPIHPFKLMEFMVSPVLELRLNDIELFCAKVPEFTNPA